MEKQDLSVFSVAQIRACEERALKSWGLSGDELMLRAASAAFNYFRARFPLAEKISVFAGGGNNGGDGYVFARIAKQHGLQVTVWQVGDLKKLKDEAKRAYLACREASVPMQAATAQSVFNECDVVIDAICGIGLEDDLRDDVVTVIEKIEKLNTQVLALDIPTGIQADTGALLKKALRADVTVTFIGLKLGLLTGSGIAYVGEVICCDLGLPALWRVDVQPIACKIELAAYAHYFKKRTKDWHKGLSGHVLVVGGDTGYAGAIEMAALAALRVGAGLVTVATTVQSAKTLSGLIPEIMYHGISEVSELAPLAEKADVIVVGPGLGASSWSLKVWDFIATQKQAMVVDADGLNCLAKTNLTNDNWVLTPHPGEASRLLHTTTALIQQDRLQAAKAISARYGGVCVLKGAGSLVVCKDDVPAVCDKGNPGMATAGMGDVLSGVLGGLIAQGVPLPDAARLGVYIHAEAGDLAAAKDGERGMMATDLMPYLRRLVN